MGQNKPAWEMAMSITRLDPGELSKNGIIRQKQEEYLALRLHVVGGDFTVEQMKKIIEVADRFGRGRIHLSTRQGVEIHFVHETLLEAARQTLESAGIEMGASGPRVRVVTACPGEATCRWGIIETKEIACDLDRMYFRQETPYKFKIAVTGCPHNCAKASENDVGVMGGIKPVWQASGCNDCRACVKTCPVGAIEKAGDVYVVDSTRCISCSICTSSCPTGGWKALERGYILWLGGTMGKTPRFATRSPGLIATKERLYALIEKAIEYYRANGRRKERFGHTLDRMGLEGSIEAIFRG
jgi:dissimilatory sulfite reductase (desulfoviridin) alpha/beta subunit